MVEERWIKRRVKVTEAHIEMGRQRRPERCPVAIAVMDSCPNLFFVSVYHWGNGSAYRIVNGDRIELAALRLPKIATVFIMIFDEYGAAGVGPIEFDLEVSENIKVCAGDGYLEDMEAGP